MENLESKLNDYLKVIDDVIENGQYKDNWASLLNHKVPDWYRNGKFGIFIHWGLYCVPAYSNEWYSRNMYEPNILRGDKSCYDHHIKTYGPQKDFGYRDFIPMFKAENFDAKEWAELFESSGAKYVMPVAEHHDGFQMYDSDMSDWCASKMGPEKDIIGLLKEEIEKKDMVLTASSHRVEHYWFMGGGKSFESDMPQEIPYGDLYWPSNPQPFEERGEGVSIDQNTVDIGDLDELFMQDWLVRTCELIDKYRPKVIYFDWWIQVFAMKPYLKKFAAYYYNRALEWGEEVTINYKNDAFMHTTAVKDVERGQLATISRDYWQSCTSVAKNSWGYTENNNYKEPHEVICDLIDVVSKNGALLLNVGPKADGTIPAEDAHILREIGKWLKVNGEGIYGTYPWRKYGDGPTVVPEGHFTDTMRKPFTSEDFRFTFKDESLYAFSMRWPEDGIVKMKLFGSKSKAFNAKIKAVTVLGQSECKYIQSEECLTVIGEKGEPGGTKTPVCVRIDIE